VLKRYSSFIALYDYEAGHITVIASFVHVLAAARYLYVIDGKSVATLQRELLCNIW